MDSNFQAGCPVLAASVEDLPEADDEPRRADAAAFDHWAELLAESLRIHSAAPAAADRTAILIVAAIEGAVAMCRAQRSTRPLDQTADALENVVRAVTDRTAPPAE